MKFTLILPYYVAWHYGEGAREFLGVFRNILWFVYNFFSISILIRTLFSPWRRLREKKQSSGFDPAEFFGNLVINFVMRIVGFWVRVITIVTGFLTLFLLLISAIFSFILWLAMPLFIAVLLLFGLKFLLLL